MSRRRIWNEVQLWRIQWQQVETFLDRLDGARDDDRPLAVRCKALYDAAVVAERLSQRRGGAWLPNAGPMYSGPGGPGAVPAYEALQYHLPGAFDIEAAVAGLAFEDEEPATDPPKVRLDGTEDVFELWDPDSRSFLPLCVPAYGFGTFHYPPPQRAHPFIAGLLVQVSEALRIGKDDGSDDSLFSVPRRQAAADNGFVGLKPWSELRQERLRRLADDGEAEKLAKGQPEFGKLVEKLQSADDAMARTLVQAAATRASEDVAALDAGLAALRKEDPEDESLIPLQAFRAAVAAERQALAAAGPLLTGSVTLAERSRAKELLSGLPTQASLDTTLGEIYRHLDEAIEARIAYPDGTLRTVRVIEGGLLKMWRSRLPWFRLRKARFLDPLLNRCIGRFEASLSGLVSSGNTGFPLTGTRTGAPVAAQADKLPLAADPPVNTVAMRAGQIAVVGGARPALAVVLGASAAVGNRARLHILPLRVSLAQGLGLDGVPGLVQAEAPLGAALSSLLSGDELRRGRRADDPEADGIPQEAVALWSRLKLLRGAAFALELPAPFDAGLSLPVYATAEQPLAARAGRLLVVDKNAYDATKKPPEPLFATPGELLLLRGRDAAGTWWQGVVEAAGAVVTTLEAEKASPVVDPASPLCCEPETPVVLVVLAQNSVPKDLVENVSLHRRFLGFTWPGLAVGQFLPARLDPDAKVVSVASVGNGFRFDETTAAASLGATGQAYVDRGPELEAAAQILDSWLGRS